MVSHSPGERNGEGIGRELSIAVKGAEEIKLNECNFKNKKGPND